MKHYLLLGLLICSLYYNVSGQDILAKVMVRDAGVPVHGVSVYVNSKAQASTNVAGYAEVRCQPGDTLRVRSIQYEHFELLITEEEMAQAQPIYIDLSPKTYQLEEVVVKTPSVLDLMKTAFSYFSDEAMTGDVLIRQYLAENGHYNKLSQGIGVMHLPAAIRTADPKKGRLDKAKSIKMDLRAICLQKEDLQANAVYAFDPYELMIRSITSDAVFTSLFEKSDPKLELIFIGNHPYWRIRIEQSLDNHRHLTAIWTVDRNNHHLVHASETQYNSKTNESHKFEFEFVTINDQTYPYRAFHEHKKNRRKTQFTGGQELFFSYDAYWREFNVMGTFETKRPDLARLGKELIDCAAIEQYIHQNHLPTLSEETVLPFVQILESGNMVENNLINEIELD